MVLLGATVTKPVFIQVLSLLREGLNIRWQPYDSDHSVNKSQTLQRARQLEQVLIVLGWAGMSGSWIARIWCGWRSKLRFGLHNDVMVEYEKVEGHGTRSCKVG